MRCIVETSWKKEEGSSVNLVKLDLYPNNNMQLVISIVLHFNDIIKIILMSVKTLNNVFSKIEYRMIGKFLAMISRKL